MNNSVISIGPRKSPKKAKTERTAIDRQDEAGQAELIDLMFAHILINDEKSGK